MRLRFDGAARESFSARRRGVLLGGFEGRPAASPTRSQVQIGFEIVESDFPIAESEAALVGSQATFAVSALENARSEVPFEESRVNVVGSESTEGERTLHLESSRSTMAECLTGTRSSQVDRLLPMRARPFTQTVLHYGTRMRTRNEPGR